VKAKENRYEHVKPRENLTVAFAFAFACGFSFQVRLVGSCIVDEQLLLVYRHVTNGSLSDHLHGGKFNCHGHSHEWQ
jgi:hypothetical protein